MQEKVCGTRAPMSDNIMSLGALRMVHNIVVTGGESLFNNYIGPRLNLELNGFSEQMRDPRFQATIDEILIEISNENPEVLQYFTSPYARLCMVWLTVATSTLQKKSRQLQKNVRTRGPQNTKTPHSTFTGRGPKNGKILRNVPSDSGNTRTV